MKNVFSMPTYPYPCVNTQSYLYAFVDMDSLVHFTLLMLMLSTIIILLIANLDADSYMCASHSLYVNPTENYCSCLRQSLVLLLGTVYMKRSFLYSESWNGEAFATRIKLSSYIDTPCQHLGFSKFPIPFPDLENKNMLVLHTYLCRVFFILINTGNISIGNA